MASHAQMNGHAWAADDRSDAMPLDDMKKLFGHMLTAFASAQAAEGERRHQSQMVGEVAALREEVRSILEEKGSQRAEAECRRFDASHEKLDRLLRAQEPMQDRMEKLIEDADHVLQQQRACIEQHQRAFADQSSEQREHLKNMQAAVGEAQALRDSLIGKVPVAEVPMKAPPTRQSPRPPATPTRASPPGFSEPQAIGPPPPQAKPPPHRQEASGEPVLVAPLPQPQMKLPLATQESWANSSYLAQAADGAPHELGHANVGPSPPSEPPPPGIAKKPPPPHSKMISPPKPPPAAAAEAPTPAFKAPPAETKKAPPTAPATSVNTSVHSPELPMTVPSNVASETQERQAESYKAPPPQIKQAPPIPLTKAPPTPEKETPTKSPPMKAAPPSMKAAPSVLQMQGSFSDIDGTPSKDPPVLKAPPPKPYPPPQEPPQEVEKAPPKKPPPPLIKSSVRN